LTIRLNPWVRALAAIRVVDEQAREAEDAFFWVTHYERGFGDMAMSG
jgi:hypothetical protein